MSCEGIGAWMRGYRSCVLGVGWAVRRGGMPVEGLVGSSQGGGLSCLLNIYISVAWAPGAPTAWLVKAWAQPSRICLTRRSLCCMACLVQYILFHSISSPLTPPSYTDSDNRQTKSPNPAREGGRRKTYTVCIIQESHPQPHQFPFYLPFPLPPNTYPAIPSYIRTLTTHPSIHSSITIHLKPHATYPIFFSNTQQ